MRANGSPRQRGAYFTPPWLAEVLAEWAIRDGSEVVLDPAAGEGSLLRAAGERMRRVSQRRRGHLIGVELHKDTCVRLKQALENCAEAKSLQCADFFEYRDSLHSCDVVLANPPFVRYHSIPKLRLAKMKAVGRADGLQSSGLASSWVFFLLGTMALLRPSGRIAMVLPVELLVADYARRARETLLKRFERVTVHYLDEDVFSGLGQRVLLVLAEGYNVARRGIGKLWVHRTRNGTAERLRARVHSKVGKPLGGWPPISQLLFSQDAIELEKHLQQCDGVQPLGGLAEIRIGYVTGANAFFHISEEERNARGIAEGDVNRAACETRSIGGIVLSGAGWRGILESGRDCWLVTPNTPFDDTIARYLRHGRGIGVANTFKCSTRQSWWKVPVKPPPPAFMPYMGRCPRIVANHGKAVVSNSFLELRGMKTHSSDALAVASLTSAFQLSALVHSRQLGGGLKKLDVGSAKRLLVPVVPVGRALALRLHKAFLESPIAAMEEADDHILVRGLNWKKAFVRRLRSVTQAQL